MSDGIKRTSLLNANTQLQEEFIVILQELIIAFYTTSVTVLTLCTIGDNFCDNLHML